MQIIQTLLRLASALDKQGLFEAADSVDAVRISLAEYPNGMGEFWLYPNGQSEYADGDIGDSNHDMIAARHMFDTMGYDVPDPYGNDEVPYSANIANVHFSDTIHNPDLRHKMPPEIAEYHWEMVDNYGKEYDLDLSHYLAWKETRDIENPEDRATVIQNLKKRNDELFHNLKDPRGYAMKNLGWVRLAGNFIQIHQINPEVCSYVANALYDAYEDRAELLTYEVEIDHPVNKYLRDVTLDEIESGDIIKRYRELIGDVPKSIPRKFPSAVPGYNHDGG